MCAYHGSCGAEAATGRPPQAVCHAGGTQVNDTTMITERDRVFILNHVCVHAYRIDPYSVITRHQGHVS
jgi:hypothetical protein